MRRKPKYRVVGIHENGDRVILTKDTTREIAERIVRLMTPGSTFAELLIEADDSDEAV
jgi:hypothetical protein